MRVDIIIDTVCPWCYIGKRRLEAGLALRPDVAFEVRYHPFLLAPDMPREGKDRKQHYREKFGDSEKFKAMTDRLLSEAGDIAFNFDSIERVPNTIDSHRLIAWAAQDDLQPEVAEGIMKAYFTDGRDIGTAEVLTDIAVAAGLDAAQIEGYLATDNHREDIAQAAQQASGMGISGVPFYVFDSRVALSGAQPAEVIAQAVDKALESDAA